MKMILNQSNQPMIAMHSTVNQAIIEFPKDLREWLPGDIILALTLQATTERRERVFGNPQWQCGAMMLRPQMLLSIVTYGYATNRYASCHLERAMQADPTLSYLAMHRLVSQNAIRTFRRQWRLLIQDSLVRLLALAWEYRQMLIHGQTQTKDPISALAPFEHLSLEEMQQCINEANQRLEWAIQLDSMDWDT